MKFFPEVFERFGEIFVHDSKPVTKTNYAACFDSRYSFVLGAGLLPRGFTKRSSFCFTPKRPPAINQRSGVIEGLYFEFYLLYFMPIYSMGSIQLPFFFRAKCRCESSAASHSVVSPTAPITSPAFTWSPSTTFIAFERL